MLLQTNSYIVPKEKKAEHSRLIRRFRQTLMRLGCDHFEVYEQVGSNWSNSESQGRYVQILRFLDRKHQLAVQSAERTDPTAQAVIADFCELINFPYQQQQGLFAVGFYTSVLPVTPKRGSRGELVSTVEHEVVDDPEAEMPYPGASDGPPVDESPLNEAEPSDSMSRTTDSAAAVTQISSVETLEPEFLDRHSDQPHGEEPMDLPNVVSGKVEPSGFNDDEFSLEALDEESEFPLTSAAHADSTRDKLIDTDHPEILGRIHRAPDTEAVTEVDLEEEELLEPEEEPSIPAHTPRESESPPVFHEAPVVNSVHGSPAVPQAELVDEMEIESESAVGFEPLDEDELEPVDEMQSSEPLEELEAIDAMDEAPQHPHPAVPNTHGEQEFLALMAGEITEADEARAHGFIEGELVDDLENEHLNGMSGHSEKLEELTGHELEPAPRHKSKNAPSPW